MAEKKGGDLKAFYWVLGATAVIAVGSLGWSALGGGLSSAAMVPSPSIVMGEVEDLEALVEMATGVERGDPNAPITILEFGDFDPTQSVSTITLAQGLGWVICPRGPVCDCSGQL